MSVVGRSSGYPKRYYLTAVGYVQITERPIGIK
jgi:hypothetical protein